MRDESFYNTLILWDQRSHLSKGLGWPISVKISLYYNKQSALSCAPSPNLDHWHHAFKHFCPHHDLKALYYASSCWVLAHQMATVRSLPFMVYYPHVNGHDHYPIYLLKSSHSKLQRSFLETDKNPPNHHQFLVLP